MSLLQPNSKQVKESKNFPRKKRVHVEKELFKSSALFTVAKLQVSAKYVKGGNVNNHKCV